MKIGKNWSVILGVKISCIVENYISQKKKISKYQLLIVKKTYKNYDPYVNKLTFIIINMDENEAMKLYNLDEIKSCSICNFIIYYIYYQLCLFVFSSSFSFLVFCILMSYKFYSY